MLKRFVFFVGLVVLVCSCSGQGSSNAPEKEAVLNEAWCIDTSDDLSDPVGSDYRDVSFLGVNDRAPYLYASGIYVNSPAYGAKAYYDMGSGKNIGMYPPNNVARIYKFHALYDTRQSYRSYKIVLRTLIGTSVQFTENNTALIWADDAGLVFAADSTYLYVINADESKILNQYKIPHFQEDFRPYYAQSDTYLQKTGSSISIDLGNYVVMGVGNGLFVWDKAQQKLALQRSFESTERFASGSFTYYPQVLDMYIYENQLFVYAASREENAKFDHVSVCKFDL